MSLETKRDEYIRHLTQQLTIGDPKTIDQLSDYLTWGLYGPNVFSQFGFRYDGVVVRQYRTNVRLTVKVNESGVPLVGFVTSSNTMGSIEQMFDLLWAERIKWQKDKYPWT